MYGLAVIVIMSLSGHLSNIDEIKKNYVPEPCTLGMFFLCQTTLWHILRKKYACSVILLDPTNYHGK